MKRAWINLLLKKFDEAREDAHRSLEYHSDPSVMWNSFEILGHCYAMRDENRKAEHHFEDAITGLNQSDTDNAVKDAAAGRISKLLKYVKGKEDIVRSDENYAQGLIKPRIDGINAILKCATDAVEVKVEEETGRAIYARRDLKPGDLIMVDDPYVSALNRENFETHCNYCYKRFRSSIPCDTCSRVWFCSEECLKKAKAGFHSSECHVLNFLYEDSIDNMGIVVFRILLRLTWENIKSLRKDGEIDTTSPDSHPLHTECNWQETYCTDNYLTIYKLVTNSQKRNCFDLFKKTIIAVYIKQCLKEVGFFKGDNVSLEDEIFVASLILKHIQSYSCNALSITEFNVEESYVDNVKIINLGGGIYPTISLLNHSCDPNVSIYFIGEVCVVRATKIIGKGKQLFLSYGPIFNLVRKESRHTDLKNQYMFDCKCIACKENWPLYEENTVYMKFACPVKGCKQIVEYDGKENMNCPSCGFEEKHKNLKTEAKCRNEEFKQGIDFLKVGQKDKALFAVKRFQMYADKNIIAPSMCLTDCQEMLKRCFLLQGNLFESKRK